MDTNTFEIVGKVAGIGGLSLGVMLLLYRDVIRKNIFPRFKSERLAYRLLRLIIISVWIVAVVGISAWVIVSLDLGKKESLEKARSQQENSLESELIPILNMRAEKIMGELSKYYKYTNVKEYLDKFEKLHRRHIDSLQKGNFVLAHEILVDIHELSFELEKDELMI